MTRFLSLDVTICYVVQLNWQKKKKLGFQYNSLCDRSAYSQIPDERDHEQGFLLNVLLISYILDEELHVVELEPEELEKCEDISEVSPNTICTKAKEDNGKCLVRIFFNLRYYTFYGLTVIIFMSGTLSNSDLN